jgi:hypothetical protein
VAPLLPEDLIFKLVVTTKARLSPIHSRHTHLHYGREHVGYAVLFKPFSIQNSIVSNGVELIDLGLETYTLLPIPTFKPNQVRNFQVSEGSVRHHWKRVCIFSLALH